VDIQSRLGLQAPNYYKKGLTSVELLQIRMFQGQRDDSELHDFYKWRNGMDDSAAPMDYLWMRPGYYWMSAQDSVRENAYAQNALEDWQENFYPIFTNGGGGRYFVKCKPSLNVKVPIFIYEPYSDPVIEQIYDGIKSMLSCVLSCYERRVYTFPSDGLLRTDFKAEVEICRNLNPKSDYWNRKNLY